MVIIIIMIIFLLGFSMSQIPILIPRLSSVLFPSAYNAGARVHSNSWAGGISMYSEHSLEIDSYLYEHPDFLVIMAAGNHGNLGPGSIGSPANSKNAICVGSIQIRNNINDKIMNTPLISYTSSIGPTYDGRYKPDILAHGDSVVSAYSSSPEIQYEAQHMR